MWGHFQLQAGTLTSAKAALGERKPSARGCLSFQQLPGEMPNIEMHLTQRCTTRTHHPTPRSSQALTPTRASLQEPLNSQTKQLPAPMEQENPTGGPGRRLGWRGHIIIPNAQQPSPLRQRGCTYSPADAAPKPNTPPFTPPSPSPQNKTHTQEQKETRQEKPNSNSTTIPSVSIPRRRECRMLWPRPRPSPAAPSCPVPLGDAVLVVLGGAPFSFNTVHVSAGIAAHEGNARFLSAEPMRLEMHDDFSSLIGNTAWVLQSQE